MAAWLSGLWAKLLASLAIAAAILLAVLKIRQGGRDAERAAQAGRNEELRRQADETRNAVDAAGDADLDRLRHKWTRPD